MGDQMTRGHETAETCPLAALSVILAVFALILAVALPGLATEARAASEIMPGQDVQLPDNDLIEAARDGDVDGVDRAIRAGISPDDTGIGQVPAIVVAAERNHLEVVKFLLEKGANPNRPARDGRTALSVAAQGGRERIVTALLDHGADPNLLADHGDTALFIAVRAHRSTIVQMLLTNQ